MITAIFQPEISNLESQIAQLQAQIALHQERITHLNEAESTADTAIASLQVAVEKISVLSPAAIASLKATVLGLFGGDDTPGDGNDGDRPNGDGGSPIEPNPESDLNGQCSEIDLDEYWQQAQPDGSAWELATPIACLLSDAPVAATNQYARLVRVSDAISYMKRFDGQVLAVYAAFSNKHRAKIWGEWLSVSHSVAGGFEIRSPKRLTSAKHELKLWGTNIQDIERLAKCDLTKSPPSNFGDAPKRQPLKTPQTLQPALIEDLEVGHIVCSISVPAWKYRIVGIKDDILDCERLNASPSYRIGIRVGGVALVSKVKDSIQHEIEQPVAQAELAEHIEEQAAAIAPERPLIDPLDVPRGVFLERSEDWIALEYFVRAHTIVRVKGVPTPQIKTLGRLIETDKGIAAYANLSGIARYFPNNETAVRYLVSVAGTSLNEIAAAFDAQENYCLAS